MKTLLSQKQRLLDLFNMYGGRLSLGQLLARSDGLGYKCTSRFSELRKEGHPIEFKRGPTPSENTWTLTSFDKQGQGQLTL